MSSAEMNRQLESLLKIGVIEQLDYPQKKIRVSSGQLMTTWLDWPAEIGNNFVRWRPLRTGAQVLLASPSGDLAQALIIGMLYSESIDSPSVDPNIDLIKFTGGSFVQHDASNNTISIHAVGNLNLTAEGNIKINGKRVDIN